MFEKTRDGKGEVDIVAVSGQGDYFLGGPSCEYNGKQTYCLTFTSESGGINSNNLIKNLSILMQKKCFLNFLVVQFLGS